MRSPPPKRPEPAVIVVPEAKKWVELAIRSVASVPAQTGVKVIVSVEVVTRSWTFVSVPVAKVNVGPSSPLIVVVTPLPASSVPQIMLPAESVSSAVAQLDIPEIATREPEAFVKFTRPVSVEVPETMRFEMVVEASVTVPMFVIRIAEVEPTCKFMMSAVLAERMKVAAT